MNRSGTRAFAITLLLLGGSRLVACEEDEPSLDNENFFVQMAEASCQAEIDTCETPNHADIETCVMETEQELRDRHDDIIADESRRFDGGCANRVVAGVMEPADACVQGCSVYPGDKKEGDTCSTDEGGSDCDQGLACTDRSVCVKYVDFFAIPQGAVCRDFEGSLGTCAAGFACAGGDTCVTEPATNETCLSGASGTPTVCGVSQFCEPMMRVCLDLKADGEVCTDDDECRSTTCQGGVCGMNATCLPPVSTGTCF